MNRDEVKQILLLYRPGTADMNDPEVAEALALVQNDSELSHWFEEHCARQSALREKFRQFSPLPGLKEQIISEQAAKARAASRREKIVGAVAAAAIVVSAIVLGFLYFPRNNMPRPIPNTFAGYENQMVNLAVSGYYMSFLTNDPAKIKDYLAKNQAPSDYALPAGLQKAALVGCTVQDWQKSKASMICFRTGKPLVGQQQSDLWLFVIDCADVKNVPVLSQPQLAEVNGLMTAAWTQDDKLYLLGVRGDEQTIQQYL